MTLREEALYLATQLGRIRSGRSGEVHPSTLLSLQRRGLVTLGTPPALTAAAASALEEAHFLVMREERSAQPN